jgi:hypothetical protein
MTTNLTRKRELAYVTCKCNISANQSLSCQPVRFISALVASSMTSTEPLRPMDDTFEDDADPDLDISKVKDRVWLVKLPKWLIEHWSKTDEDNVELARIQIPYVPRGDIINIQNDIQCD